MPAPHRPGLPSFALGLFIFLLPQIAWSERVAPVVTTEGRLLAGRPVQIAFTFRGIGEVTPAREIKAGGLTFTLFQSFPLPPDRWQILYTGTPAQPGRYVIPERTWSASSGSAKSSARAIRVKGTAVAAPAPPDQPEPKPAKPKSAGSEEQQLKWLQNRVRAAAPAPARPVASPRATPKPVSKDAPFFFATPPTVAAPQVFLGQAVPVDVRFYLRADKTFEDLLRPVLAGNGFLGGAVDELPPSLVATNGADYHVIELVTTVVPLRTGALEVPGMVLRGRHSGPSARATAPPDSWIPFELPTKPLKLEVLPLPAERPPDFTGGVGVFEALAPEVNPRVSQPGEPVTLRLSVEGRGNFRAMQQPVLDPASLDGWRVYDAGETIEMDDAAGHGAKTFEVKLVAAKDVTATPSASMSYFNPESKEFVQLTFPPEPVTAPAASPGAAAAPSPAQAPPIAVVAPASRNVAAVPVVRSSWFIALQVVLLALIAAWLIFSLAKRRAARGAAGRRARLQAEYDEARAALGSSVSSRADFYAAASRTVLARLALLHGRPLGPDETDHALARLVPNLVLREDLSAVLRTSDELNYGAAETGLLTAAERESIRNLLGEFDEACR